MSTFKNLIKITKGTLLFEEPMKNHTSYGIGGPAEAYIIPQDSDDLLRILNYAKENLLSVHFIGSGSNLLVSDDGIRGLVISPRKSFKEIKFNKNLVFAQSGAMLGSLVRKSTKRNLTGLETLIGVPGTIGGALVMNAGAFGSEISNFLKTVSTIRMDGKLIKRKANQINFSYRNSTFKKDEFILSATFELTEASKDKINKKKEIASKGRKTSQPLKYRSAGSVFKNPKGDFAAGYLIEQVGLKGYAIGNAQISDHHANFFINHGNAKAKDIMSLIKISKEKVFQKFNINLELEVKALGFSKKD
jgi:UDP-N-acetylmuramate dehydrogenase